MRIIFIEKCVSVYFCILFLKSVKCILDVMVLVFIGIVIVLISSDNKYFMVLWLIVIIDIEDLFELDIEFVIGM